MRSFPAKVLLFGEYSILLGSAALGIPFHRFPATLRLPGAGSTAGGAGPESNRQLLQLFEQWSATPERFEEFLSLDELGRDIGSGLFLDSAIPVHYGLGSSGALCAALMDGYGRDVPEDPGLLKHRFSLMESAMHGKSSGIDPLISWLGRPVKIHRGERPEPLDAGADLMPGKEMAVFLLDTGFPCGTGPLVEGFLATFCPGGVVSPAGHLFRELADRAVDRFLQGPATGFAAALAELSAFELHHLAPMVPEQWRPVWRDGLTSGRFTLKLCGSGGGGFLLCFSGDPDIMHEYFATSLPRYFAISLFRHFAISF